jgi:hypothetical protein
LVTKILPTDSDCFAIFSAFSRFYKTLNDIDKDTSVEIRQIDCNRAAAYSPAEIFNDMKKKSSLQLAFFASLTDGG